MGDADGAIDISVTGGTAPYTYSWTGTGGFTASTQDLDNLAPGTYNLTVTDKNLCSDVVNGVVISQPDTLVASLTLETDITCFGDADGAIDISVTGGTAPYTYSWTGTGGFTASTQDLDNLAPGTYNLTVTDKNLCSDVVNGVVISQPDTLVASLTLETDITCFGDADGAIDISVTGGTAPYTYSWTGTGGFTASTQDLDNLAPGTYNLTVTDKNLCSDVVNGVVISQPDTLVASLTLETDITCFGDADGAIDISVTGGTAPYTYSWTGTGGFTASTQDLDNLAPGTYNLTVTDKNLCSDVVNGVVISQPDTLVASLTLETDITCFGDADGAIDISVTGGTAPYTYSWTGTGGFTASTQDLDNLAPGTYNLTVTDKNLCSDVVNGVVISQPDTLVASLTLETDITCFGDADGAIDISVTGGTASLYLIHGQVLAGLLLLLRT